MLNTTKRWIGATLLAVANADGAAQIPGADTVERFESVSPGAVPTGWQCGVTGRGSPKWAVERSADGQTAGNVLRQTGSGDFPWCVKNGTAIADGFVEVRLRPVAGREDQAGGVVWRWQDANNYYVARANALENNVSLYITQGGRRITIKYVDSSVPRGRWSTLRAEFSGRAIRVALNGQTLIALDDARLPRAGKVGVWTKADSVTEFDQFRFSSAAPK